MTAVVRSLHVKKPGGEIVNLLPDEQLVAPSLGHNTSAMFEITNEHGQDLIVAFDSISAIRIQTRQTLYQDYDLEVREEQDPNDKRYQPGKAETDKLKRELARTTAKVTELQRKVGVATERLMKATEKVEELEAKQTVGRVEAWTYDSEGNVSNHFILDHDDIGEEIPIGNVVITLQKEEPK